MNRKSVVCVPSKTYSYDQEPSHMKISMNNDKLTPCYSVPSTKLKNVICVACKHKFYVQDISKLNKSILKGSQIPLLLNCGHPICNKCDKKSKSCPLCDKISAVKDDWNQMSQLPLNLYTLGLIISSHNHSSDNDDKDFQFHSTLSKQLHQITQQGSCHECGYQATVKCPQCIALYCHCCYSKIHGRALQGHTQISINEEDSQNHASIFNSCSSACSDSLSYFCNDCNIACCSNCTLCSHKMHDYVALSEKNQSLLPEFNKICTHIEETSLRVCQTKKKIDSILMSNTYEPQNSEIVEASISQHFAYLHGVLQNMEAKLRKHLYQQGNCLKKNLEDIEMQLRVQEKKLKVTLQMASYVKQTFHKVDIQNAINILKEMADVSCHLMYKDISQNYKAAFTIDDSIVTAIENHCTVEVPPISSYSLVRTNELPENYILSPINKKTRAKISDKSSLMPLAMTLPIDNVQYPSTISIKPEDKEQESISDCKVEVTYVVNPSLFFVRKVASKSEFVQLEKDLMNYANDNQNAVMLTNIKKDDICIIKQWKIHKWYRGRVNSVNTSDDDKTTYNVFYLDYGYEECNIPTSRIQNISESLQNLPPQAIRCCLHGVKPKNTTWTNTCTNDFMKMTNGVDCVMLVIKSSPDILYVDLCVILKDSNMGPQSLCNTMKVMDYARLDTLQNTTEESKTIYVYDKEELPLNKTVMVTVSWVESPDKIYVRKAGHKKNLSKITNDLKEYYENDTSAKMIDAPQKGLPCAVQLEDDTWERGEIIEIISENTLKVFCVDWGCTLRLERDALREIPYEYTTIKAQAIRISLMYVMPEPDGNWKSEAFVTLMTILNRARCVTVSSRKKTEDGYSGCICSDNIDVSRQLKAAGVVNEFHINKFKNISSTNSELPFIQSHLSSEKVEDIITELCDLSDDMKNDKPVEKKEITKDPFKVEVRVQRVTTPDCIYVAQIEHTESNAAMVSTMQKFYNTFHSESRDNWNEGSLCAAYSAKDKSYFRAKILKIHSPMEVLVYFYDMGIEETVTIKDIQVLHKKFAKELTYCFKVKLAGILPCGGSSTWPSLSCIVLSDIIRENAFCKFYITKPVQEEVCNDMVIPVELWVRQIKIPGPLAPSEIEINSINRMLIDKGVALPVKNYFAKADSILAIEFKRQLEGSHQFMQIADEEDEVKWLNKNCNITNLKEIDDTIMSRGSGSSCHNSSIDALTDITAKYQICDTTNRECAVQFSDWLPPSEITEEVFHAIPTYVDNQCNVYLYPKKRNTATLQYIESELQTYYKCIKIKKEKQWKEGDLCIAKYHHDKKWYRGRVIKNLENILQVEFVDYGNIEDCEIEHITDHVRLGHIPIQCTKCVISGLKPDTSNGKWVLYDLDRIHALLVDQECKVTVLQRQPTHLVVSITLLQPWKSDLLIYLANHMDMNIKIERKEWNYSDNSESEKWTLNSTKDIENNTINDKLCITDGSKEFLAETYTQNITFNEDVISGTFIEPSESDLFDEYNSKQIIFDSENTLWADMALDTELISSTPQVQSEEEDFTYKQLIIPQDIKYIELILCCNKDPTTSFAQLGENNDDMFSSVLHEYYLRYKTIMSDLQVDTCHQPLIESFRKNTPCIAKFSDSLWYRCIIAKVKKFPDTQKIYISLYYVDYGNHEYRMLDLLSKSHDLYVPKEKWLELPGMAIKCTFWGLNFISDDINLLASKLNEIYNQAVVARIKEINDGNNLVAEIYKDKSCKELFYAHLIEDGLYQFKKPKED